MKRAGKERHRQEGSSGKVSQWHDDFENPSLIRDKVGNKYEMSTEDYAKVIDQHRMSRRKETELTIARELLESNLKKLTDKQRAVMYHKFLGASDSEIAKVLDVEPSTVRSHFEAGRQKLAEHITRTREFLEEELDNE